MRLSRTDLVPMLAIVAGGMIGASLSFGLLGSRSDDAAVPESVVNAYESVERAEVLRIEVPQQPQRVYTYTILRGGVPQEQPQWVRMEVDGMVVTGERIEVNGMVITAVVAPSATAEFYLSEEQKAVARARALTVGTLRWSSDLNGFPVPTANKIEVEEPQRFLWTFGGRQVEFYPPNIEFDPPEIELTRER